MTMAVVTVGKKTPWPKKFLLPLCVLTLTLILCVYVPSNTRMTLFTQPKAIPRPITVASPSQQTHRIVDRGTLVRSLNSAHSSNETSYPTVHVPNRALSESDQNTTIVQTSTLANKKSETAPLESTGVSRLNQSTGNEKSVQLMQRPPESSGDGDIGSYHQNANETIAMEAKELKLRSTESKSKTPEHETGDNNVQSDENCHAVTKIVFIKIHKTGSTTMSSIFERFGYRRNLMFALPRGGHIFSNGKLFSRHSVVPIPKVLVRSHPHFDILDNHARYNRKELNVVVPNAKYITILRDPVQQLESAFGYFEMAKGMGISAHSNPFETFMQNPYFYYTRKNYTMKTCSRNGQLFDLGFDPKFFNNTDAVLAKIHTLSNELDLVLLTEYFDESLILMKKHLCWSFDDILYISNGIRSKSHRFTISERLAEKIRRWNAGDVLLYNHFNKTFWEKIQDYGESFEADLQHFRKLEREVIEKCVDTGRLDKHDRREDMYVISRKHPGNYCQDLLRADVPYTALLKRKMKELSARLTDKVGRRLVEHRKLMTTRGRRKS